MKMIIVICVVVLLMQLGMVGLSFMQRDGPPPKSWAEVEDRYPQLSRMLARLESTLDFFRPRLELGWNDGPRFFSAAEGTGWEEVRFEGGPDQGDQRIAKFEWVTGSAVAIRYKCGLGGAYKCPQVVCVCDEGRRFDAQRFADCRVTDAGPICGQVRGVLLYGDSHGKTLEFKALGSEGGTIRQK